MPIKKIIICCALLFLNIPKIKCQNFSELRKKYELYSENDGSAFKYLHLSINKAKNENNTVQLVQAYKDAVYFSAAIEKKLQYADSCITAAEKTENNDLISSAHLLKGGLYYFNSKRYKLALDEYLKAYQYSKTTDDAYLKYKIFYHIGMVKSYMGFYQEAQVHFESCMNFFGTNMRAPLSPNTKYNYTKGYLNSLHQSIVCHRNLKEYAQADSLIAIGRRMTEHKNDFPLEKNYFIKCIGIAEYYHGHYENSLGLLQTSLPAFLKYNDYGWYSISNYYIGKNYLQLKKTEKAILYFKKVDSVFQKQKFILPELRENYEQLILYYKKQKNTPQELHYYKTLLKVDSIIHKDFSYLSARIHKEYDTEPLKEREQKLAFQKKWGIGIIILAFILIAIIIVRYWSGYKKEQKIRSQYKLLENKLTQQQEKTKKKTKLSEVLFKEIERKLEAFEQKKKYREKGLTLEKLAKRMGTNSNYLSHVVHETKKTTFNKYLAELRIHYITELLENDKNYLKYTVETLADECGLITRQNFSDLFQEINGIRPKDFIQQRMSALEAEVDKEDAH